MRTFYAKNYIEKGLSLGIFRAREVTEDEPIHSHDFIEIVYVTHGRATQFINGREYEARRGDLFFINYGSTHRFTATEEFGYYNVCFDPEIISARIINRENAFDLLSLTAIDELRGEGAPEGRIHFGREERPLIEALLADMLSEYTSTLSERCAVLESYMTVLVTKILRKTRPVSNKSTSEDAWEDMLRFLDGNIDKKLTLAELAKKCFYNPSYFSRTFKERCGMSLVEYVTRARVGAAERMLTESELSSEHIAEACGFGDKSGLYRAFARYHGMSPGEYRQKYK